MPTRHGTSRTTLGWTCACTSRTTRADLASPTTPSPDALPHTRRTPGLLPSWAPLPALLNRSGCRATTSEDPATWMAPLSASSSRCTRTVLQHSPRRRLQAAALLQMQEQTRSLSPQTPKATATANSSFLSSTASTRHSSGVRFPTRHLPALRTSSPLVGPAPFRRNASSRSSSPSTGPNSRPRVSTMIARALRSSASSTCLKSTRPRSRSQADNAKVSDLYWKPLSWLGTIGPSSVNDVFDSNLWATFVSTTIGLVVPSLSSLSLHHNNPLAKCGCKKHYMNFHGDHTSTCTAYSGATKAHDWLVGVLGPIFRTAGHTVCTQHGVKASAGQRRGDVEIRRYLQDAAGRRSLVHLFFPRHHEHKHTHVLRVFASSFSTGPPGNRSAFHCSGMSSQRNQSDSFRFKRAAFYLSLKSKVGLGAAKVAALRINLNVESCGIVDDDEKIIIIISPSARSLLRSPSPPPPSFTQSPSPPRSLVRDGQTSPHRSRLVVSRSTCPPLPPSPHANSFIIGTAVTNTHTLIYFQNKQQFVVHLRTTS
jgi:hypothetical protein